MRKRIVLPVLFMLSACIMGGCNSGTPDTTIPTINNTLYSREGDKVIFFEGGETEEINTSMEAFNNVIFKIENGRFFVAFEDGTQYRTNITSVDGMMLDERSADDGIICDLYIFRGKRILYKISLYAVGYAPFTFEDMEKGFGTLKEVK